MVRGPARGPPVPIAYSFTYGAASFDSPSALAFRQAAAEHLARVSPTPLRHHRLPRPPVPMDDIRTGVSQGTQPQQTIAALAQAAISVGATAAPQQLRATSAGGNRRRRQRRRYVMVAPTFPQPMYEALRDLSQELLLPGLDASCRTACSG